MTDSGEENIKKTTAYISFGSNTGDRAANLKAAVSAVVLLPDTDIVSLSPVFETEPVGFRDQPDFYNAAARLETGLEAETLLGALLGIEAAMHRKRSFKYAPRIIDIDLLIYGNEKIDRPHVTVPHPRMAERGFITAVLSPIAADNPELLTGLCRDYSERITEIKGISLL